MRAKTRRQTISPDETQGYSARADLASAAQHGHFPFLGSF
jgi:hypothetical protein